MTFTTNINTLDLDALMQESTNISNNLQEQMHIYQHASVLNAQHILDSIHSLATEHKDIGREMLRRAEQLNPSGDHDLSGPDGQQLHALNVTLDEHDLQNEQVAEFKRSHGLDEKFEHVEEPAAEASATLEEDAPSPTASTSTTAAADVNTVDLRACIQIEIDAAAALKARIQRTGNSRPSSEASWSEIKSILQACKSLHESSGDWFEVIRNEPSDAETNLQLVQMVRTLQSDLRELIVQSEHLVELQDFSSMDRESRLPAFEAPPTSNVGEMIENKDALDTVSNASNFTVRDSDFPAPVRGNHASTLEGSSLSTAASSPVIATTGCCTTDIRTLIEQEIDASTALQARIKLRIDALPDTGTSISEIKSIAKECKRLTHIARECDERMSTQLPDTDSTHELAQTLQRSLGDLVAEFERLVDLQDPVPLGWSPSTAEEGPASDIAQLIEDKDALDTVSNASNFTVRDSHSPTHDEDSGPAESTDHLNFRDHLKEREEASNIDTSKGSSTSDQLHPSESAVEVEPGIIDKEEWPWPYRILSIDPVTPNDMFQEQLERHVYLISHSTPIVALLTMEPRSLASQRLFKDHSMPEDAPASESVTTTTESSTFVPGPRKGEPDDVVLAFVALADPDTKRFVDETAEVGFAVDRDFVRQIVMEGG